MKNLKLIVLTISAVLFLGISNVNAQNSEPQTVIIKVFEFPMMYKSRMIVTEPSGTTKTTELKTLNYRSLEDVVGANNASIQAEINNWKKEGYEIDGLSNSALGDATVTTIILSKED